MAKALVALMQVKFYTYLTNVRVDPYIISFKKYPQKDVYSIIAFQHQHQNRKY
jgi:hypothetical protein